MRRTGAFVVCVAAAIGAFAAPASAHAVLLDTSPSAGQVLDRAPAAITLRFNENIEVSLGAVRLFDEHGDRVDTGLPTKPSSDVVAVQVRGTLTDGSYVVTWRVVSADSHPVEGAFTFQVGGNSNATSKHVQALAARLLRREGSDRVVGVLAGIARGALFAGMAVLIGAGFFVLLVWPRARRAPHLGRVVWAAWWTATVATVAGILLQGPYGAALGLGDAFKPDVVGDVLGTRYGHFAIIRLAVLLIGIPILRRVVNVEAVPSRHVVVAGAVLTVALVFTPGLAGHAATGDLPGLAVPLDALHVLAMSIWIGGLVVLGAIVLARLDAESAVQAVTRFSRTAFACVAVLIVTGGFQTWRQVGGFDAFRDTDYGKILIVKLVLFAVLLLVATRSRQIAGYLAPDVAVEPARVPLLTGGSDDVTDADDWVIDEAFELRRLRRFVGAEMLLALAIISATALLVNAVPAKIAESQGSAGLAAATLKSNEVWVDVTIVPGRAGLNAAHITAIRPDGAPINLTDLVVTLDLPAKRIAAIKLPLRKLGPGHYVSPGLDIPIAGTWRVTAKVTLSQFDEVTVKGTVTIANRAGT